MIPIINNICMGWHVIMIALAFMLLICNFFKKKTLLSSIHLYGEHSNYIAFVTIIFFGLLLCFDFHYSALDFDKSGLSSGAFLSFATLSLLLFFAVFITLNAWHNQIKET